MALFRFAEAWLTLAWIDLVIRLLPYRHWRRWLQPVEAPADGAASDLLSPLVLAVERAARRHLVPMNCLRRTLALQRMLARRQIATTLHLGVRRGDGRLEAHAWLSCGGRVLNDAPDVHERYAELKGKGVWDVVRRGS